LGLLAQEQGHYERATALYEESLALARTSNDKFGVAYALLGQGDIARSQGNAEEATAVCEEALQLLLELGNKIFAAYALNTLALAQRARGNREQARALLEEGLAVARESLGSAEPSLFTSMGMVALDESDADRAEASFCESLTYTRIRGPLYDVAMNLEGLASVAVLRGLAQRAAQLFGAADAIRTRIGIPMWPVNRLLHDRHVASVRAALGNEGFRIAWEAGYTMAVEQVIADAMQETAVPVTGTRLSIEGDREPGNRVD
jgi:tetratricopeptide (TPR) repeat protein